MADKSVKDFFISYNKADRSWAEWIGWELEEANYTVVIQAWDFRPGSNFILEMQRAATLAERTIAVLSPDYLTSSFTQPEWAAAFAQDPRGEKGILLPVRVRECDLKGLLPQIVYIDLVGTDEGAAREALLKGVVRGRAKPATKPVFPNTSQRAVPKQPRFPNALPPVWNIPHNRNPNFTGRETLLDNLKTALRSGQPAALTQAIHGLGGVGKTQTAVEYAYSNQSDYEVVWWMRSEEPTTLAADYAALATELGLPEKDEPQQSAIVKAVRRWLTHNTGWLLIFDNATDQASLRTYLPPSATGHVLVTSRDPNWRGLASPLQVEEMERAESVKFLLKRTGLEDESAASPLAEELGDLPLALEQAGAYIEETRTSFSDYLTLFKTHRQKLLQRGSSSTDYPASVATTWELSFQQAKASSPLAEDLMNLFAFFAPDDIPLEIIREGAALLPASLADAVLDPILFNDAIAALRRYSLAEVQDNSFLSIHRLVQAVVRDRLDEEARKTWAQAAVSLVNSIFPDNSDDVRTWHICSNLLPHALAASEHARELQMVYEAAGRLLNQVGLYLVGRAEYAGSRVAFEQAIVMGEALYGADHPSTAIYYNNLGYVLKNLREFIGARVHLERALTIDQKAYGTDHPDVAIDLNNLGALLDDLGDFGRAQEYFERALAITERVYGKDHAIVATNLNNLGVVLKKQGDLAGARAHHERALAIDEKTYGVDHPNTAIDLVNLGLVLYEQKDFINSRMHFERACRIFRNSLGENHPSTVKAQNDLDILDNLLREKNSDVGGEV
jgi:tetratricopeptide (TPR) repeat protein